MVKVRQYLRFATFLMFLSAQTASADLLFTNFDGAPFAGSLYLGGGACDFLCLGMEDNFSNNVPWNVGGFTLYIASAVSAGLLESGGRFALFTAAGAQIVAPTNTATTVTDTGLTGGLGTHVYKLEISGLSIALVPGEYQFRFTNTNQQSISAVYGTASEQAIAPGWVTLQGALGGDALLPANRYQRVENWAFQVYSVNDTTYEDGFEDPEVP